MNIRNTLHFDDISDKINHTDFIVENNLSNIVFRNVYENVGTLVRGRFVVYTSRFPLKSSINCLEDAWKLL